MKVLKKILIGILTFLILLSVGGYIYFDRKFTTEDNNMTFKNDSGTIPIVWLGTEKNVLLLPIHFSGNPETYYLQFDTGSPYTLLYSEAIKNLKEISVDNERAKSSFWIGKTQIYSHRFKVINTEKSDEEDSIKIIGTIGADVLESRKTLIDFKNNQVVFNVYQTPNKFKN